jgi:hypothetical protein
MGNTAVPSFSTPHPIPSNWGNPDYFEWKAEEGRYFCKLCWKYADDSHILSEKHTAREQYPEHYLGADASLSYCSMNAPPPPPKYPSPSGAPSYWESASVSTLLQQVSNNAAYPEILALTFPEHEAVKRQVACDPMPFRGDDHVVDAGSSMPPPLPGASSGESAAFRKQHEIVRWQRFAVDESRTSFWWCCEATGDSFVENRPGAWVMYADPQSLKSYWWLNDEKWFWVHTGSTIL